MSYSNNLGGSANGYVDNYSTEDKISYYKEKYESETNKKKKFGYYKRLETLGASVPNPYGEKQFTEKETEEHYKRVYNNPSNSLGQRRVAFRYLKKRGYDVTDPKHTEFNTPKDREKYYQQIQGEDYKSMIEREQYHETNRKDISHEPSKRRYHEKAEKQLEHEIKTNRFNYTDQEKLIYFESQMKDEFLPLKVRSKAEKDYKKLLNKLTWQSENRG